MNVEVSLPHSHLLAEVGESVEDEVRRVPLV